MSTAPLDPPTPRDDLVGIHDYTAYRFAEYDRAQAALGRLRSAYSTFSSALAEAGAAMDAAQDYNPEEWYEDTRRLTPADLGVPGRVVQYLTHDPEQFLEADVMVAALHRAMFVLAESVEGDLANLKREMRATEKEGAV